MVWGSCSFSVGSDDFAVTNATVNERMAETMNGTAAVNTLKAIKIAGAAEEYIVVVNS